MIIYDTIRVVIINISFIYDHLEDKHNREMLPFVSLTNTLAIRFT